MAAVEQGLCMRSILSEMGSVKLFMDLLGGVRYIGSRHRESDQ